MTAAKDLRGRVDNRTLSEQVYEFLRSQILSDQYPPGTELNELSIADSLGVSRGPVREAMGRLRTEGLVEVRPRRGAVVTALSRGEFLGAYQVREALEVLAIRLAVPRIGRAEVNELRSMVSRMEELARAVDESRFFDVNAAFHALLVRTSENQHLIRFHTQLAAQMRRYRSLSAMLRGDLITSVREHRAILQAVTRGEAEKAAELLAAHVRVPQRAIQSLSDEEWTRMGARRG
jgi:DNA-binding GntR family transcriptional regulator